MDIDMPDIPDMLVEEGELAALVLMLPMFIVAGFVASRARGEVDGMFGWRKGKAI